MESWFRRRNEDIVEAHRVCSHYGAPIVNRGGGTSLSGETVNFAVVIDNSKYLNRIGEADTVQRLVTVEPGAINEQVNKKVGKTNLVFGPDPSSHAYCTIGGNIGNNSCGIHSVQAQLYGPGPRTSDNVHSMEIVTYRGDRFHVGVGEESQLDQIIRQGGPKGEIYRRLRQLRDHYTHLIRQRFPSVDKLPRRVSGYNLDELLPERGFNVARALVGTESTCATALEITLMLTPALLKRVTAVVQYDELPDAAEHISEIMEWKPIGLEALDQRLFNDENMEHKDEEALKKLPRSGKGRLAADRVWGGQSERSAGHGGALSELAGSQEALRGRPDCPVRPSRTRWPQRDDLEDTRGRAWSYRVSTTRQRSLAWLGGLGRPAGQGGSVSPRPEEAL